VISGPNFRCFFCPFFSPLWDLFAALFGKLWSLFGKLLSVLALAGKDFLTQMKIAGPKNIYICNSSRLQFYQSSAVSPTGAKRPTKPLIPPFPFLWRSQFELLLRSGLLLQCGAVELNHSLFGPFY
jgi:hypothetical protein